MKTLMSFAFVLIAFIAIAPAHADAPSARAWLDRDTMHLGETVTLNVEATGDVGGQPDFSALSQELPNGGQFGASAASSTTASGATPASTANPVLQAFQSLGKDLQSGNLTAAQQDFAAIQQISIQKNCGTRFEARQLPPR